MNGGEWGPQSASSLALPPSESNQWVLGLTCMRFRGGNVIGYYSQPGAPCQKGGKKILERVAVESLSDYYHGHTHPLRVHPISPPRQPFHYTQ